MIERTLEYNYDLDIDYIFDIIADNNSEIVEKLTDIFDYKQGKWLDNKRKDLVGLTLTDIPSQVETIASLFVTNNQVYIKEKIRINERTANKILVNVKIKIVNTVVNLIFKLFKYKINIILESNNPNNTNVKIIYKFKSLLSSSLTNILDNYIEENLKTKYMKIIDDYLQSKVAEKMI